MTHAGSEAIAHLQRAVTGATVTDQASNIINCETCSLSKAHRLILKRLNKKEPAKKSLIRSFYDLIEMIPVYNEEKWISHFSCYYTSMDFIYTHHKKLQAIEIIKKFINMIKTRYDKKVQFFRINGERSLRNKFNSLVTMKGIITERSALATPTQNETAERSRGVIVIKTRCLRIVSSLPASLWSEIVKTAGYLNNRTSKRQLKWKTPVKALIGYTPNLAHLYVYDCRAYPLNKGIPRRQKLDPRAYIDYLIGYDSSNIYRIWIPSKEKVIRTRDVTFNEQLFYDPAEIDLGYILREETEQLVEILDLPSTAPTHADITQLTDEDLLNTQSIKNSSS
jgi:hypothetical protein